jgi:hypothetical protein
MYERLYTRCGELEGKETIKKGAAAALKLLPPLVKKKRQRTRVRMFIHTFWRARTKINKKRAAALKLLLLSLRKKKGSGYLKQRKKKKKRGSGSVEVAAAAIGEIKRGEHAYEHLYTCSQYLEQKAATAALKLLLPPLIKKKGMNTRMDICTRVHGS